MLYCDGNVVKKVFVPWLVTENTALASVLK